MYVVPQCASYLCVNNRNMNTNTNTSTTRATRVMKTRVPLHYTKHFICIIGLVL